MQALDLNLASRPFRNNTLLWLANVVAVVLLVAFTTWNIRTYSSHLLLLKDLRAQVESIESEFADLDRRDRLTRLEIGKFDVKSLAVKTQKANDVLRWKAFSWTELFNLMERIQPNDVRMTAVRPVFRPDPVGRREIVESQAVPVSVEGLAKDLEAFLALESALMNDPHFDRVEPGRIAKTETTDELMFELNFLYDPTRDAPAESDAAALSAQAEPAVAASGTGAEEGADGSVVEGDGEPAAARRGRRGAR